eukprot:TRINITY_DN5675_c0_g1_i3.p1 TRINITY_DN5675_c0_g1~~TRINITY_DN5675_c0_g1_i3.p1  ORF type:complete len:165 (+),score=15.02 TRINITY_DN5675_c0_g1_i3:101-595(+)
MMFIVDMFGEAGSIDFSALDNTAIGSVLQLQAGARLARTTTPTKFAATATFNDVITQIESGWNLHLEMGRRTLIDAYILESRRKSGVIMFPEHRVKPVALQSGQKVHGSIDYVMSPSGRSVPCDKVSLLAGQVVPREPVVNVVVAKSDEAFRWADSCRTVCGSC